MDLDGDVYRDATVSFGPASVSEGSILPYEGRAMLLSPHGLPPGALDVRADGWLSPDVPILVRGLARIIPLAWSGDPQSGHGRAVTAEDIAAFASRVQAAGEQWAGIWRVLALEDDRTDSIGSYTAALRQSGATHADCWTYSETVGVALVRAGSDREGTGSLALHIVPAGWVSEPRAGKPVRDVDVSWTWGDVVALFETRGR